MKAKHSIRALALAPVVLALGACVSGGPSGSDHVPVAGGKSGEAVYQQVCRACHETGVAKAPKFGDREAWEGLIEEGQDVLTAHAWVGVRGMPPRGGDPSLTLAEFSRATAFMARAAGGDWRDPDTRMLERIRHEEKKRLKEIEKKK
ncbi:c-type cytochrome [Zeimonas arvi]|uniref:c-type cytochrome n=1 Tax=Zeimonas arvi TaxID=2498847 RepID=UPI001C9C9CF2|nr:c-type cytochrome [Zeimonas arvi]